MSPRAPASDHAPDPHVVTQLLREQAPHLAHLPIRPSGTSGSSNWVFRVGDDLAVRMPRTADYVPDLLNEVRWLSRVAPGLSVAVPEVHVVGRSNEVFPRPWLVVCWVPGETPGDLDGAQQDLLARTLGHALRDLHACDTGNAPAGESHWGYRCGEPVTGTIDGWAEQAATALADVFDPTGILEAWRRLRDVPAASQPACLVHTDLSSENLLVDTDGRLAGLIDFGAMGVGDRSIDFLYAWSLFDEPARTTLFTTAGTDDATWARARAWAFVGPGLLTLANYRNSMPGRTDRLTAMVDNVAAEVGVQLR